jgi:DNA-binding NarL/FixJ family response regulator
MSGKRAAQALAAATDAAPRVVIADDHPVVRRGVRMALIRGGFDVVAEASNRDAVISAVSKELPDLCLLDLSMPGGGLQAAEELAVLAPATSVVILTASDRTEDVVAALRTGAVGYLTKDMSPDRLAATLRGVLSGEAAIPRALFGRVLRESRDVAALALGSISVGDVALTARESETLRLLNSGMTTIEVGETLSLSPITVRRHVSTAVAKLGVADRRAALQTIQPLTGAA